MNDDRISQLTLDGGCLVFDFINTVNSRKAPGSMDYLENWEYLIQWAGKVSMLSEMQILALTRHLEKHPGRAKRAFRKLIRARELLYSLFFSITRQEKPGGKETGDFNELFSEYLSKTTLRIERDKSETLFSAEADPADEPLWVVMKSAWELLTTASYVKIKECPSCGWLFLDKSKNGKRRWCNMLTCGSNDKATRYYHRKKMLGNRPGAKQDKEAGEG